MKNETIHPQDETDRAALAAARPMMLAGKGKMTREGFAKMLDGVADAAGVRYEPDTVGGVSGVWCRPENARPGVTLLHLHGGRFVSGTAQAYRHLAGQIAARARMNAFVADYRLAPENRFPAAMDDARAVLAGLHARDAEGRVALSGDSAGGGLALSLLASTRHDPRRPYAAALISPWTDLTQSGASYETRADADPLLDRAILADGAKLYLGEHDPRDPLASPHFADLAGYPRLQIHVGDAEVLLDDSTRLAERAAAANVDVDLHVWEGMLHVFPSGVGRFAAAAKALDLMGAFLRG